MTLQRKADLALVLVTVCWGTSYYQMDICLAEMDPFMLNTYRFLGAFAVAGLFAFPKLRSVSRATMKYAALIGLILTVVYATSTFGVRYTSQSNAGFLCAMAVVFTPILAWSKAGEFAATDENPLWCLIAGDTAMRAESRSSTTRSRTPTRSVP